MTTPLPGDVIAALRELHKPHGIYDECCHHDHDDDAKVTNCGEFVTCLPPMYFVCRHCCCDQDDYYQLEVCVDSHDHGPGKPVCETAAILDDHAAASGGRDTALEVHDA
jgi:hypothetical protein